MSFHISNDGLSIGTADNGLPVTFQDQTWLSIALRRKHRRSRRLFWLIF
jgi:hypothetical protein